jgi:hypothetical protein
LVIDKVAGVQGRLKRIFLAALRAKTVFAFQGLITTRTKPLVSWYLRVLYYHGCRVEGRKLRYLDQSQTELAS